VANIKSQQKRNRTNERARLRKQVGEVVASPRRSRVRDAADHGDKEKAAELLLSTTAKLDKAASRGVIHKNQAANKKSGAGADPQQDLSPTSGRPAHRPRSDTNSQLA